MPDGIPDLRTGLMGVSSAAEAPGVPTGSARVLQVLQNGQVSIDVFGHVLQTETEVAARSRHFFNISLNLLRPGSSQLNAFVQVSKRTCSRIVVDAQSIFKTLSKIFVDAYVVLGRWSEGWISQYFRQSVGQRLH
ncbi:hypothetical protein HYQ46_008223 [Verticillium longisporum]|nr:hypothetical protein HYQ46_008223 [Verticillium longisporum]